MVAVGMSMRDMASMDSALHPSPRKRGFAAMSLEMRRAIAAKGGASVPGHKRSYAKDRDLAAEAGRKGGSATRSGGRPKSSS